MSVRIKALLGAMIACFVLSGESAVELKWIGKEKVVNHHNDVPYHVLEKQWTHGEDANTENMVIHGDNLLALKSLLPRYEGKIKCIYIDPPYNTGNEGWCYNDNVNDPRIKKWLGEVVGKEGEDFTRHDKWLCMMYPRLKLLQRLLADDGYVFVSINFQHEEAKLRLICDEIFGGSNYIGTLTWESVTQPANAGIAKFGLQQKVEPILCYIRDRKAYKGFCLAEKADSKKYPHMGKLGPCRFEIIEKSDAGGYKRDTMKFSILGQFPREGKRWQIGEELARELERTSKVEIVDGVVKRAIYPEDEEGKVAYDPFWSHFSAKEYGTAESGKGDLNSILGFAAGFDTVKPCKLLESIMAFVVRADANAIILDSFAGSGTTGHAVLNLNKKDGGNRKFILVEMCDYADTITAERVKRVIDGYGEGKNAVEGTGGSFGYYELGPELMKDGVLNEAVGTDKIREYVFYTETKQSVQPSDEVYKLGEAYGVAYYFCYEKDRIVTLDRALLRSIKTKAESYVIFADTCTLSAAELERYHITFKKIPRDITRF